MKHAVAAILAGVAAVIASFIPVGAAGANPDPRPPADLATSLTCIGAAAHSDFDVIVVVTNVDHGKDSSTATNVTVVVVSPSLDVEFKETPSGSINGRYVAVVGPHELKPGESEEFHFTMHADADSWTSEPWSPVATAQSPTEKDWTQLNNTSVCPAFL